MHAAITLFVSLDASGEADHVTACESVQFSESFAITKLDVGRDDLAGAGIFNIYQQNGLFLFAIFWSLSHSKPFEFTSECLPLPVKFLQRVPCHQMIIPSQSNMNRSLVPSPLGPMH